MMDMLKMALRDRDGWSKQSSTPVADININK